MYICILFFRICFLFISIICGCILGIQKEIGTTQISGFYEGAVSSGENGLQLDDRILEIDGKHVYCDYDISFLMQRNTTGKYNFVVSRNGEKVTLPEVEFSRRTGGNFAFDKENVISSLSAKIKKAGLEDGDKIIKVNGVAVNSNAELSEEIVKDTDYTVDFTVIRNQGEVEVKGVTMATVTVFDFTVYPGVKGFSTVVGGAFRYALSMSRMVYLSLFDLVTGKYGLNELAGPVGTVSVIADIAESSAQSADWSQLFTIMALITINIGLFNLLPVPALDGGRLFFMLIEIIFRKPVPQKYEGWIHAAGLVILLGFMLIISASDIWKLISGRGFY